MPTTSGFAARVKLHRLVSAESQSGGKQGREKPRPSPGMGPDLDEVINFPKVILNRMKTVLGPDRANRCFGRQQPDPSKNSLRWRGAKVQANPITQLRPQK